MAKLKTPKIIGIFLIAITIFIVIGYISIQKKEKSSIAQAIDAVPINAAVIFETSNLTNLNNKLKKESQIWPEILDFSQLEEFNRQLSSFDTIISSSPHLHRILDGKKILVSNHLIGTNKNILLFSLKITKKESRQLQKELFSLSKIDSTKENFRTYNDIKLFTLNLRNKNYYFSIIDNIFVFSSSELIIENAIRQKSSNTPISSDLGFSKIAPNLTKKANHLFLNFENIGQVYSKYFSYTFSKKVKNLNKFANWTALDFEMKNDKISLNGYTYVANSMDYYLKIFDNLNPQSIDNTHMLPQKTSEFLFFGFDNSAKFNSNYEMLINSRNKAGTYQMMRQEFEKQYDKHIISTIQQEIGNSITFAKVKFNNSIDKTSNFTILNLDDAQIILDGLTSVTDKYNKKNNIKKQYYTDFKIDNNTNHRIYKFVSKNIMKIIFGELTKFPEQQYYFVYDNYLIFAENQDDAKLYINDLYRNKTLKNTPSFELFMHNNPTKGNLLYYSNNTFNSYKQKSVLNDKFKDIYNKNINFFNKLQYITVQFSYEKDNLYQTNINVRYDENLSQERYSTWELELKNNITTKPFFFLNHYTAEREVFVQDSSNTIYLLTKNGKIIWTKKLSEKIVGKIYMVDLYNNQKYQLMFATTNNIVALDRNGEYIENYPIALKAPTKQGITVADYDNNKNYRILVPNSDNTLYIYNKEGQEITGWENPKTNSEIISQTYHFRNDDKDFLVLADKTKPYILNRKGQPRIEITDNFAMPTQVYFYFQAPTQTTQPSFVTTNASGRIIKINLDGKITEIPLMTMSKDHQFVAFDLNNDELLDYIIADDKTLFVYNSNGEKIFTYTFKHAIEGKPLILKFSKDDIKIGVTIPTENKVYLLTQKGKIAPNFPIPGNSTFSVGMLNSKKDFSLIVGNNNFICNYLIY